MLPLSGRSLPVVATSDAQLLGDIDELVATDGAFSLGAWLAMARSFAANATDCTGTAIGLRVLPACQRICPDGERGGYLPARHESIAAMRQRLRGTLSVLTGRIPESTAAIGRNPLWADRRVDGRPTHSTQHGAWQCRSAGWSSTERHTPHCGPPGRAQP